MNLADIELYPHNQETYAKICDAWKTDSRVAVVQATGTGKSYLILKCMSNFMFQNKVVLAPTEHIINQLKKYAKGGDIKTIYLTYAKLSMMSESEKISLNPSLIVVDEFHRCGADVWGGGVISLLRHHPNSKVLGTSATPIRFLDNERNMADELFDGKVVTNLSLVDAIVKEILPMPKYISSLFTFELELKDMYKKIMESKDSETRRELLKEYEILKKRLEKSSGAKSIIKKHFGKSNGKFIVFCRNIEHLNEMIEVVPRWFDEDSNMKILEIHYESENNSDKLEYFRKADPSKGITLLFSVAMLNEGVHVKDVDGVILLRPTMSPVIYYQQIGRAIQVGNDKHPLIFDFVNNFDNVNAKHFVRDLKKQANLFGRIIKRMI